MSALPADEHVRLAEQLSRDRRFDEAKQHLLAALAVDSNHAGAMIGLGALLGRVGMLSDARVVLMEALERHPNARHSAIRMPPTNIAGVNIRCDR
jgi:Flp pilus assembly protein TadD